MAGKEMYGWITGAGAAGMLGWLACTLMPGMGIVRIIRMLTAVPQGVAALQTAKSLRQRLQNYPNNPALTGQKVQRDRLPFKEQS